MTETIGLTAIMDTKKFDRGVKLYYDGLAKMQSQTEKLVRGSVTVKDAEGNLVKFSTSTANAGAASQTASGAYSNTVTQLASLVAAYGVVTKIQDFAASSFTAARSQNDIKGALVNVVGGLDQYNALIKSAQQSTRGMVSETELAQAGMVLLKSGIAENAEEVGRLSAAGTALVNTYTAQGASQEKLIRFILTGNRALIDNFNFTQQQINAKTAEIKVNEGLSGEEAKLAARKALVIQEGEKLLGSVSAETIAVGQLTAAWANFQADFGQLLILLNQGTGSLDSVTGAVQQLSAGATAWQSAIGNAQLLSQAYQRAGNETTLLDSYLAGLANTFVPVVGLFNTLTMDTNALISVLNPAAGLIQNMTSAAGGWEASLLNISNAVIDATIGHEELAKAFNDIAGEQAAADAQLQIAEDAATAAAQVQAESAMVEESKAAFMGWGISVEGAAEAHNPLIRGMIEATARAREEAKAIGELTLAQYSMENFKRTQQAQGLVGFAETPSDFSEFAAKKDEERRIAAKKADEEAQKDLQRMQEKSANELARNFEKATQDMANTISSVLQPTLSEVWQPPEGAIPRIDEAARQLATVATSGFQSEWLGKLSEQFGNADFFQPIIQAMESGDPEALKGAATNLLTTGVENLWDVETIKAKVRESLQQQNLRQAIIDQVQAELSAEGLTVSPEQVTQIATGTTQAAAGATTAGQAVSTLGTDTASAQVAMDTFNSSLNNVSTIGIPTLITKAGELISALQGIPIGITSMTDQATIAASNVANKLRDVINQSDWQNVGANIIKGTLKGIKENEAKVIEVLKAMARDAIDGVKDELGIQSPSKEFAYIGQMMVSGLQGGISSSIPGLQKTYDQLFGGISRNIASTNNVIGSAADEVEDLLDRELEGSKAEYVLERLKNLFRANSEEILGATNRVAVFRRMALDMLNWGRVGIGNRIVERAAEVFIEQFDRSKKELEALQQKVLVAGAQKAVQTATKLTELAQSAATQLNTEVDTLATLLNTGAGSFNYQGQIISAAQAQDMLNQKMKEQADIQDDILQLQQNQQRLGFLQQQLDLIKQLNDAGLNASDVLGNLQLGANASMADMVAASNAAIQAIINQAQADLSTVTGTSIMAQTGTPVAGRQTVTNRSVNLTINGLNVNNGMDVNNLITLIQRTAAGVA